MQLQQPFFSLQSIPAHQKKKRKRKHSPPVKPTNCADESDVALPFIGLITSYSSLDYFPYSGQSNQTHCVQRIFQQKLDNGDICLSCAKKDLVWESFAGKTPICVTGHLLRLYMQPLGSAAILTVLPDIVEVTADAFPHSVGEAAHVDDHTQRKAVSQFGE